MARNFDEPTSNGGLTIDRSYVAALAVRPLATRAIELGLEAEHVASSPGYWIPRATLGVDIPYIGRARGEFSINDGHGHKLVGTAQRLVRGAWLFGIVILVADPEPVREVLIEVYDALGLDWDPTTVGALQTTVPGAQIEDVRAAMLRAYGQLATLRSTGLDDAVIELARGRVDRHRVPE